MKYKIIVSIMALVMLIPFVSADQDGIRNEQIVLVSNHLLAQSGYFNNVTAYITVLLPNGSISVSSQLTTQSTVEPGVFYYNYTPTVIGTYFTSTQFYNGTDDIGIGSSTFVVEEPESMYLAILFGVLALIVGCFWYANSMRSKPITQVNTWIIESLSTRDLAVAFDIIGTFMFMPLLALLQIWSEGTEYASIFNTIFIAGSILIGFGVLLYLVMYLIYRYNEGIEAIGNAGSEKGVNRNGKQRR